MTFIFAATPTAAADTRAARPVLTSAVILGSTAYTPTELFVAYRDRLGQPITRENARAIVTALEELYIHDGYSRPELQVEDDLVARGILRINVFESHIADVRIAGDAGPYREKLEHLAAQLRAKQPVKQSDIQQTLRRMREFPGLTIKAAAERAAGRRNSQILAIDTSFQAIDAVVKVNNRGTEEIGRNFMLGQFVTNSLLGREEKLGLLFASASDFDGYHGGGFFVDAPVDTRGTRALLMGFSSWSKPTEAPTDLADEYKRDRVSLKVTHPLQTGTRRSLSVSAALEMENFDIHREGTLLRDDRLRVVEIGGRSNWRLNKSTQFLAKVDLRRGIDGLGGGLHAVDLSIDPRREDFWSTRLQLVHLIRLNELWSMRMEMLGQHSAYVLPHAERFKIGGERLGRGLEVTEVAGDRGIGGKAELRRELTSANHLLGKTSVYSFYDIGAAWKQDVAGRESAATGGAGFSVQHERVTGYLELARPLTHPDIDGRKELTVFAELSFLF